MKVISLTKGMFAQVDEEDYEKLNQFKWRAAKHQGGIFYAIRGRGAKIIFMHRSILSAPTDKQVDHKNRNGLDNTRDNLRLASQGQNLGNQTSWRGDDMKGIYPCKGKKADKWIAICAGSYLGTFQTQKMAADAYNAAAISRWGEFARLNTSSL